MSTTNQKPKRGEIWKIDFDPTKGAEIQKQRPAVIISSDAVGKLPLKLVAPITDWKTWYANNIWHVHLLPTKENGLTKESAVDALQVRSVSIDRFLNFWGRVTESELEDIGQAIAAVIELR